MRVQFGLQDHVNTLAFCLSREITPKRTFAHVSSTYPNVCVEESSPNIENNYKKLYKIKKIKRNLPAYGCLPVLKSDRDVARE